MGIISGNWFTMGSAWDLECVFDGKLYPVLRKGDPVIFELVLTDYPMDSYGKGNTIRSETFRLSSTYVCNLCSTRTGIFLGQNILLRLVEYA